MTKGSYVTDEDLVKKRDFLSSRLREEKFELQVARTTVQRRVTAVNTLTRNIEHLENRLKDRGIL